MDSKEIERLLRLSKLTREDKHSLREQMKINVDPKCDFCFTCTTQVGYTLKRLREWYKQNK